MTTSTRLGKKRTKYNIKKCHNDFIAESSRRIFLGARLTKQEIFEKVHAEFVEAYPDVKCTVKQLIQWTKNQLIYNTTTPNEEYRDEVIDLYKTEFNVFSNIRNHAIKIASIVNNGKRKVTVDYVKGVIDELIEQERIRVPAASFDSMWKPEYDAILLRKFLNQDYLSSSCSTSYLRFFAEEVNVYFEDYLVINKLQEILSNYKSEQKPMTYEDIKKDAHLFRLIADNIKDYKSRNINARGIRERVERLLKAEGKEVMPCEVLLLIQDLCSAYNQNA